MPENKVSDEEFEQLSKDSDDDSDLVRKLRARLRDTSKGARDRDELAAKVAEYERKDALREAGLDLSPMRMKALLATHDGEMTPDALHATAVELGYAEAKADPAEGEAAAQERMADATAGGGAQRTKEGQITPADAASWTPDKWGKFATEHPEHAAAIRRGESVTGVTT